MTKEEIVNDMRRVLEDMRKYDGLPPNLSTEAQLWDEIMKREAWNMPQQLFPLIKEIHGKEYPPDTPVRPLATEFSVDHAHSKEIASIRADITVLVGERDIYHFECEIKYDGTIVMRMFEYDIHIGLSYQKLEEHPQMQFQFPRSAVIYLQANDNIPDRLTCSIRFQDGSIHDYIVPTMKVQNYTLEEIREKHLCILIPFLPLRFRKFFNPKKNMFKLKKEELTSFYRQLILILDKEAEAGFLSENNRLIILNLLVKSLIRVFCKDKVLYKEVIDMTAPILELEFDKYINALEEMRILTEEQAQKAKEQVREAEEQAQKAKEQVREAEKQVREAEEQAQKVKEQALEAEEKAREMKNIYEKNVNELKKEVDEKERQILELQMQLQALQQKMI